MNIAIVFVKEPVPGRVKTRLCPLLSRAQAASLYAAFARDTLATLAQVPKTRIEVAYDARSVSDSPAWLGPAAGRWFLQHGSDLGERMNAAFEHGFAQGAQRVVLVGSDIPDLNSELVTDAFQVLESRPLVLGPAHDGGYYLIGLRQPYPELFAGVPWSTDKVFQKTIQQAKRLGLRPAVLPTFADVDTFADLMRLYRKLQALPAQACPATRDVLRNILEPKNESLAI